MTWMDLLRSLETLQYETVLSEKGKEVLERKQSALFASIHQSVTLVESPSKLLLHQPMENKPRLP